MFISSNYIISSNDIILQKTLFLEGSLELHTCLKMTDLLLSSTDIYIAFFISTDCVMDLD